MMVNKMKNYGKRWFAAPTCQVTCQVTEQNQVKTKTLKITTRSKSEELNSENVVWI